MIITYTCNKENGISIQPKEIRSEAISICEELLEIKSERGTGALGSSNK